jgi:hypothetical protein
MATLPWRSVCRPEPSGEYVVVATEATLARYRTIPRFLLATRRVVRQLRRSEGAVGFSLRGNLRTRTFSTVSAWAGDKAIASFSTRAPHRAATTAFQGAYTGRMARWTADGRSLPPRWGEVRRRLEASPVLLDVQR